MAIPLHRRRVTPTLREPFPGRREWIRIGPEHPPRSRMVLSTRTRAAMLRFLMSKEAAEFVDAVQTGQNGRFPRASETITRDRIHPNLLCTRRHVSRAAIPA